MSRPVLVAFSGPSFPGRNSGLEAFDIDPVFEGQLDQVILQAESQQVDTDDW